MARPKKKKKEQATQQPAQRKPTQVKVEESGKKPGRADLSQRQRSRQDGIISATPPKVTANQMDKLKGTKPSVSPAQQEGLDVRRRILAGEQGTPQFAEVRPAGSSVQAIEDRINREFTAGRIGLNQAVAIRAKAQLEAGEIQGVSKEIQALIDAGMGEFPDDMQKEEGGIIQRNIDSIMGDQAQREALVEEGFQEFQQKISGTPSERLSVAAKITPFGGGTQQIVAAPRALPAPPKNTALERVSQSATGKKVPRTTSGPAGNIPTNTKNASKTEQFIRNLKKGMNSPAGATGITFGAASLLVSAIGSYPFAGFIKEEALQTTGFAAKQAMDDGDLEGAEQALMLQEEILDPDVANQVMNSIPYANVLNSVKQYYEAARVQNKNQRKRLNDLKSQ